MSDLNTTQFKVLRACPDALIVYPPRAGTGLRHVVVAGSESTLCGHRADGWFTERQRFDPKTIGCKRCARAYRTPAGKALVEAKERESDG